MKRIGIVVLASLCGLIGGMVSMAYATRNASGTYSLPSGNPVVSGTTISTTWANNTLNDISTEMTDSLSRSGKGGMSAVLQLPNGTVAAPAMTFTSDTDTGVYRVGANDLGLAAGGVKFLDGTASLLTLPLATAASSTLAVTGVTTVADGAVSAPGVAFGSDTNTGLYRIGADDAALAAGGVKAIEWTGSAVTIPLATTHSSTLGVSSTLTVTGITNVADGAVGAPGVTFTSDTDTGLYRIGANDAALSAGGVKGFEWTASAATLPLATSLSGGVSSNMTMSGSNPASTTGFSNTLTPKNIAKAWARLTTDGAGNVTVNDGFNIASASVSTTILTVTFATAVSASGAAMVSLANNTTVVYYVPYVLASTGSVGIRAYDVTGAAAVNFATTNHVEINIVVFAAQ